MKLALFGFAAAAICASALASDNDAAPAPADHPAPPAVVEPEPLPPLEGTVVERPSGGFLQVTMQDSSLVLRFYDKKRAPLPADVDRAAIRIVPASRKPERVVIARSDDGMSLDKGRPIRAPHVFKLFIGLFRGTSDEAVESYTVDFP